MIKSRQEAGVQVTVITTEPECVNFGNASVLYELIETICSSDLDVGDSLGCDDMAEDCLMESAPMIARSIDIEPDDIDVKDTITFAWEIKS